MKFSFAVITSLICSSVDPVGARFAKSLGGTKSPKSTKSPKAPTIQPSMQELPQCYNPGPNTPFSQFETFNPTPCTLSPNNEEVLDEINMADYINNGDFLTLLSGLLPLVTAVAAASGNAALNQLIAGIPSNEAKLAALQSIIDSGALNAAGFAGAVVTRFPNFPNNIINSGAGGSCFQSTYEVVYTEFVIYSLAAIAQIAQVSAFDITDKLRNYVLCDKTYPVSIVNPDDLTVRGDVDVAILIIQSLFEPLVAE